MRLPVVVLVLASAFMFARGSSLPQSPRQTIQDTAEALANYVGRRNGWSPNLTKLNGVGFEDAKVRHVLTYDVGLRVKGKPREFSFSEEITPWNYLVPALPATQPEARAGQKEPGSSTATLAGEEGQRQSMEEQSLAVVEGVRGYKSPGTEAPSLPPFILEGPVQLWIEGVTQLRMAMPHDVDAGDVKKVVLAAGAAVTVIGCQEVSLARPLQVPLPLTLEEEGNPLNGADGPLSLFVLAARLRKVAYMQDSKQLLALRLVKPTAILAAAATPLALPAPAEESSVSQKRVSEEVEGEDLVPAVPRLRVKRLSPSSVELRLRDKQQAAGAQMDNSGGLAPVPVQRLQHLGPGARRVSLWPFAFHNASHAKLSGFEQALLEALGDAAPRKGTFQLTRARAAVRKLVSVPFEVELQTTATVNLPSMLMGPQEEEDGEKVPRPVIRQQWEMLLQEGQKGDLRPVHLKQLGSVQPTVLLDPGMITGNLTSLATQEPVPKPPGLVL